MKHWFRLLPIGVLALGVGLTQAQQPAPVFTPTDCSIALPPAANAECGTLTVPEDRSNPDTRTIDLPVVIIRASGENASPDPLVFLQGGPGGATLPLISQSYEAFIAPLAASRDIVFFDQRGTGAANPALSCIEVSDSSIADLQQVLTDDETEALYLEAFIACRDRLTAEGITLSAYTSAENAADVADLATVLGYEQINLYGGSYGVRLALTVMRDFEPLVRSAVLDSAIPVEIDLYNEQAFKTDFALNRLFAACAADAACAAAYPDLEETFYQTVADLDANPAPLTISNPLTGATYDIVVTGTDFIGAVFFSLQVPQFLPDLPTLIYEVAAGDVSVLGLAFSVTLIVSDSVNIGMFASVNCHEEAFASSPEDIRAAWDAYPRLSSFAAGAAFGSPEALINVCEAWGAKAYDPRESEAVVSSIPSLALAGELDPATPAIWTEQITENLANSTFVEFPGMTHVVGINGGCAVTIVEEFLSAPDQTPSLACVDEMTGVRFNVPSGDAPDEAAGIELIAYDDEDGWSSVVPSTWTEAQPGVFARATNALDPTVLVVGIGTGDPETLLGNVLGSIGVTEIPAPSGSITTAAATWSLYEASAAGFVAQVAVSADTAEPYLVVLITSAAEAESLVSEVLLPAVEAFTYEP